MSLAHLTVPDGPMLDAELRALFRRIAARPGSLRLPPIAPPDPAALRQAIRRAVPAFAPPGEP